MTLFVFRKKHPSRKLPYKVPLYPVTPILFILACIFMLYSSLAFTGKGALIGAAFLALGIPVYIFSLRQKKSY
jgi:basic amino acid/polyamine antiporter, APA family